MPAHEMNHAECYRLFSLLKLAGYFDPDYFLKIIMETNKFRGDATYVLVKTNKITGYCQCFFFSRNIG